MTPLEMMQNAVKVLENDETGAGKIKPAGGMLDVVQMYALVSIAESLAVLATAAPSLDPRQPLRSV